MDRWPGCEASETDRVEGGWKRDGQTDRSTRVAGGEEKENDLQRERGGGGEGTLRERRTDGRE